MSSPIEDPSTASGTPAAGREPVLFTTQSPERTPAPITAWLVAGAAVLLLIGGLVLFSHHSTPAAGGSAILPVAAGAASLAVPPQQVAMSESTSLSGGKSTYIDGHIINHGQATITDATVQVLFANDAGSAPQVETTPLTLIRTRQPYVDVEPVSAEPIKPGEDREFRLIFEGISPSWNQQLPEIRIVHVASR